MNKKALVKRIKRERRMVSFSDFRAELALLSGKIPQAKIELSLFLFAVIKDAFNLARLESMKEEKRYGFDYDDYELALMMLMRNNDLFSAYAEVENNYKANTLALLQPEIKHD